MHEILRTRVGYCGGVVEHPTYHAISDHTEAISLDYDPTLTSYEKLLDLFWNSHRCDRTNGSRQYMNAIFYRDDTQRKLAEESKIRRAAQLKISDAQIETSILPVNVFTYAEGYHQKYYLTRYAQIRDYLNEVYPSAKALGDSTVAARLNAYLGSGMERNWPAFLSQLPSFGLPEELETALRKTADSQIE
ncbi:MAG: peptide-methionine (S)-S-oxide reductase [Verrucomicrobiales bacterium]